jgi:beta-lactamase class A
VQLPARQRQFIAATFAVVYKIGLIGRKSNRGLPSPVKSGAKIRVFGRILGILAVASSLVTPSPSARADDLEKIFDSTLGTEVRRPPVHTSFDSLVASVANSQQGRIGVAALDLTTGRPVAVLGDQPFPLASTSKIAIAATFLEGVDQGRWKLTDQFPLMVAMNSPKFAGAKAPVQPGAIYSARTLLELSLTRSSNPATDALLHVVGGPKAVNSWIRRAGISGMRLDRDIATLVRDDGEFDPARTVDIRDSTTPTAMIRLLTGLRRGDWLSPASRDVLLGAMGRCVTGKHRIAGMMPAGVRVAHKTGTLNNTSSDVGFIETPDGRVLAVAIYVTGQGGKPSRDARIASIARTVLDGYQNEATSQNRLTVR